jgi:hypothetical protein
MHHIASYIPPRMPRAIAAILVVLAVLPAAAGARSADERALWATVNVCDTIAHPNVIGIRGSMPGADNTREQMYMRFRVQFFNARRQEWHNVAKNGDSGFIPVGPARYKARQAGQLFTFAPPTGATFKLRGKVIFQWRLKKKVIRSVTRLTTAGHHSNSGSDPEGYSSDTCLIS